MKRITALMTAIITTLLLAVNVFAQDTQACELTDVSRYLGASWSTLQDELDLGSYRIYNDYLTIWSADEAVYFYGKYDTSVCERMQRMTQIDLTESAEGKYRMGDVWIGENVSDVQASMRNGNFEMILDTDLDGIHFRRSYRNADTGLTYIVYYGQFSYVEKITLKYTNGL